MGANGDQTNPHTWVKIVTSRTPPVSHWGVRAGSLAGPYLIGASLRPD